MSEIIEYAGRKFEVIDKRKVKIGDLILDGGVFEVIFMDKSKCISYSRDVSNLHNVYCDLNEDEYKILKEIKFITHHYAIYKQDGAVRTTYTFRDEIALYSFIESIFGAEIIEHRTVEVEDAE